MITIKTKEEIAILKQGGSILARVLNELIKEVKPDISTSYLDKVARDLIFSFGAKPAFEGYKPSGASNPYPCALCASPNNVVVHGVPKDSVVLKEGDILKLDLGIKYQNLFTDAAITVGVGEITKERGDLIEVTRKALELGVGQVKAGSHIGDIGAAIANFVESRGLNIIRSLVGHGVGYAVHEEPNVPNYGKAGFGPDLKSGMVLAIEPMVTVGSIEVRQSKDGFGYETIDGSLSAHFEHTVAVTGDGCLVLTKL